MMKEKIAIIAELYRGRFTRATHEVISFARELGSAGARLEIIIPGKNIRGLAEEIARTSGIDVIGIEAEALDLYSAEPFRSAILDILKDMNPAYVCLPHSAMGFDLAPGLAVDLGAACITAVDEVREDEKGIYFLKSMWGGKMRAELVPMTQRVVLTVLPGAWTISVEESDLAGSVRVVKAKLAFEASEVTLMEAPGERESELPGADVIVSAGRGIGKEENLGMIRKLAGIFSRGAVGASRSVCDLGWLGYKHQIGFTGRTVSPGLYIACGISGAIQHISGMKDSQMVIAINIDPHAPIFGIADYCIVEDLTEFIPALLDLMERGDPSIFS